jgi:predicted acylesterase/phospholipase RssA
MSQSSQILGEERRYWDGGFSSNLPLSKAINLLEQVEPDNADVERELIVIELFPMRSKVPGNLIEVQDRVTQLLFSSKLILVITMTSPELSSGASDFSEAAIERRIAAGYHDALNQLEESDRRSPQDLNAHLNANGQL